MKRLFIALLVTLFAVTGCKKKSDDSQTETNVDGSQENGEGQPGQRSDDDMDPSAEDAAAPQAGETSAADEAAEGMQVVSEDILARDPVTESAQVKHILISWDEKASIYANRGGQDERGAGRSKGAANRLAVELQEKASEGGANADDFNALMAEYSEDKGSARAGRAYPVTPSAGLVQNFKDLALRLEVGEVGIVESIFGYHIMKRTE